MMWRRMFIIVWVGALLALGLSPVAKPAQGAVSTTFTVNSLLDSVDETPGDGDCKTTGGVCTLRAALMEAAVTAESVDVNFNIPGGALVISPLSALPQITNASLRGPNQSGGRIIIDGSNAGSCSGLYINNATAPVTITGLQVQKFSQNGIMAEKSSNVTIGGDNPGDGNIIIDNTGHGISIAPGDASNVYIKKNYIGVETTGVGARPNNDGVYVFGASSGANIQIVSNLISSNLGWGVRFVSSSSSGSKITGNTIGLNASGLGALPNASGGILISKSSQIQIGGGLAGEGNIIASNGDYGIQLNEADTITIQGNVIGTNLTQTVYLPNGDYDLQAEKSGQLTIGGNTPEQGNVLMHTTFINGSSSSTSTGNTIKNNRMGISAAGLMRPTTSGMHGLVMAYANNNLIQSNVITHFDVGLRIASGTGNQISQNSIYENKGLGIDLGYGLDVNDPLDVDSGGPNENQNYPVVTSVDLHRDVSELYLDVFGELHSKPNFDYVIEVFSSPSSDAITGYGEGKAYVGYVNVTTDEFGDATWSLTDIQFTTYGQYIGKYITATATEVTGQNTSEFSQGLFTGVRIFLPTMFK